MCGVNGVCLCGLKIKQPNYFIVYGKYRLWQIYFINLSLVLQTVPNPMCHAAMADALVFHQAIVHRCLGSELPETCVLASQSPFSSVILPMQGSIFAHLLPV